MYCLITFVGLFAIHWSKLIGAQKDTMQANDSLHQDNAKYQEAIEKLQEQQEEIKALSKKELKYETTIKELKDHNNQLLNEINLLRATANSEAMANLRGMLESLEGDRRLKEKEERVKRQQDKEERQKVKFSAKLARRRSKAEAETQREAKYTNWFTEICGSLKQMKVVRQLDNSRDLTHSG